MVIVKIEDFGFQPVMGKEYVVTFTQNGELLSTSIYNGAPLPSVSFPDNAKIGLAITDKETGKNLMSSEFISYNGKLYKTVFDLPLKNPDTNKNANVHIKDLHYDLSTGSVLVQIQGFKGDQYKLLVSDTTVKHQALAMPITLEDDMFYSIPTELVQGNSFEVLLQDQHGKSIDIQEFTAPISTDWRYTDTVEDGTLQLDPTEVIEGEGAPEVPVPPVGQEQTQTESQQSSLLPDAMIPYKTPLMVGGVILLLVLVILIMRMINKRKARRAWEDDPDDVYDNDIDREELDRDAEERGDNEREQWPDEGEGSFEEVGRDEEDRR